LIVIDKPEEFDILPGKDENGSPIFSVIVKRTYDILPDKEAVRSEHTNPLIKVDEYYDNGDPELFTVKYETDLIPYKIAADFVVIGKAYAPEGNPLLQMDISAEVSGVRKNIRVIGDRRCIYRERKTPLFTDPLEFTEMEIRYEKAYGGMDDRKHPFFSYPRNSRGAGFVAQNIRELVDGMALPNLEDPQDLLTPDRLILEDLNRWNQQPLPQGFGWFQRTWYPRCSFAGSVPGFTRPDEVMREEILGLVPRNQVALARQFKLPSFDIRFNNGASPGFTLPLSGGEKVRLTHLTRDGLLEFILPKDKPGIMLDIGLGENELSPALHTVCVRVDDMQVDMVWRGAHEYPGYDWLPEMPRMIAKVW